MKLDGEGVTGRNATLPDEVVDDSALVDAKVTQAEENLVSGNSSRGDFGREGSPIIGADWNECDDLNSAPYLRAAQTGLVDEDLTARNDPLAWKRKPTVPKAAGACHDGRALDKDRQVPAHGVHPPSLVARKAPLVNVGVVREWQVVVGKKHRRRGAGSFSPEVQHLPVTVVDDKFDSAGISLYEGIETRDDNMPPDIVAHDHRGMECSGSK
ncbi:hypothetical protein Dimus_007308 [Dionaea muscipula]